MPRPITRRIPLLIAALTFILVFNFQLSSFQHESKEPGALLAAVNRFGIDDQNTRRIFDPLEKTGFPFQKRWSCPLGGTVESQPIVSQGCIYVQAGGGVVKISTEGEILARSPLLTHSGLPGGASPTYAWTPYGNRIYQATRDHRLWALDPDDLTPLWDVPFLELAAGNRPECRYRVTASPLVIHDDGKVLIALGTGNGDGTGLPDQYADNGFFIIEDLGKQGEVAYSKQMLGEVTGSPLRLGRQIIATENQGTQPSRIIQFLPETMKEAAMPAYAQAGIPGSPAAEGNRIYVADRESRIYGYRSSKEGRLELLWTNPEASDTDAGRIGNSYNLKSPVIGSNCIYLPIQHYAGRPGGAVAAVDKDTGQTVCLRVFDCPLRSNLIYWKPDDLELQDYLLVFEADGTAALLDAQTLENVCGFMAPDGSFQNEILLVPPIAGSSSAPEPVLAENLLLLVDGEGTMHAFQGRGPVNFICDQAEGACDSTGKIQVRMQLANQSKIDYTDIPVVIGELDPQGIPVDEEKLQNVPLRILFESKIDLPAGCQSAFTAELPGTAADRSMAAVINPPGHSLEKKEEILPRSDNYSLFRIGGESLDLEVLSLEGPGGLSPGKPGSIVAQVCNHSVEALKGVHIGWYQDGDLIREEWLDFKPWEIKTLRWLWQSPKIPAIVQLKVWADPEEALPDVQRLNNQKEIHIALAGAPPVPDCSNPLDRKSWDVTYSLITGYRQRQRLDCHADRYGKLNCRMVPWTDYSSPIWEYRTVRYTESLSLQADVSTGQNLLPDPKHSGPQDQECRGAWEIIPYAQAQGIDPDEVTRAGYGFRVQVTTDYRSDWEQKVPKGLRGTAYPIGGAFSGPDRVTAEFYDTRGNKAGEAELVRTGGTGSIGQGIWELPETLRQMKDGTVVRQRKHFTQPEIPDGDYIVLIKATGAGRHGLFCCSTQKVRIFGSMYDDQYGRTDRAIKD